MSGAGTFGNCKTVEGRAYLEAVAELGALNAVVLGRAEAVGRARRGRQRDPARRPSGLLKGFDREEDQGS